MAVDGLIMLSRPDHPQIIVPRGIAQSAGLKLYFSGEQCKLGHVSWRNVLNRVCLLCLDEWRSENPEKMRSAERARYAAKGDEICAVRKVYRAANPEKIRAWKATEYVRHRDKIRARRAALYLRTKDKVLANTARWAKANKDKRRAIVAKYYLNHTDRANAAVKRWAKNNPEKVRLINLTSYAMRRARKIGVGGTYTTAAVEVLLKQQQGSCAYAWHKPAWCERKITLKTCHRDHIIPLAKGGTN